MKPTRTGTAQLMRALCADTTQHVLKARFVRGGLCKSLCTCGHRCFACSGHHHLLCKKHHHHLHSQYSRSSKTADEWYCGKRACCCCDTPQPYLTATLTAMNTSSSSTTCLVSAIPNEQDYFLSKQQAMKGLGLKWRVIKHKTKFSCQVKPGPTHSR